MPFMPPQPSSTTLFSPSQDGWENSSLQSGFCDWRDYSYCYRRAADDLAERFAVPLDSPEAMFLPILFLYRHAVEAALKGIAAELAVMDGLPPIVLDHHRIDDIWQGLRPRIDKMPGGLAQAWFARAESLILELSKVDPNAEYFRYPANKSGTPLLTAGFTLSVKHAATTMRDLFFVLDNVAGYLSAANDFSPDAGSRPA